MTTADDVEWWIRQRITALGLDTWFHPSIDIKRSPDDRKRTASATPSSAAATCCTATWASPTSASTTDMQHNAYVLRLGETEAPAGLRELLRKGNRLQEIHLVGDARGPDRATRFCARSSSAAARRGCGRPSTRTRSARTATGRAPMIGMPDKQEFVPGTGEHPLHADTVYSIEFSVACRRSRVGRRRGVDRIRRRGGLHRRLGALGGRLPAGVLPDPVAEKR